MPNPFAAVAAFGTCLSAVLEHAGVVQVLHNRNSSVLDLPKTWKTSHETLCAVYSTIHICMRKGVFLDEWMPGVLFRVWRPVEPPNG